MAEEDRQTKAERREEKRLRRIEEEAAAASAAKKARTRNGLYAVTLIAVIGGLVFLAVGNQAPTIENAITVAQSDVEAAMTANGCEELDVVPLESREHLQPATAPPAENLYTNGRPTSSGPHYETWGPIYDGVRNEPLDERSTTHNLEHGSVIVWFDADQVDSDTTSEIDSWVKLLNNSGFESDRGSGGGILAAPVGDWGIDSGKAIAIRAWGKAMDCDSWSEDAANGYVIENFGTRGNAPESPLSPYPEDALEYDPDDQPADDSTDAPAEDGSAEPSEPAAATDEASEATS